MKVKASWLCDRFTGQVEEGADPEGDMCTWLTCNVWRTLIKLGRTVGAVVHLPISTITYAMHGCKAGTKEITSCFILLQVWAWERLPYLAPGQLGKRPPKAGAPLIGRWDDVFHSPNLATHLVGTYRYHLDMQRPNEATVLLIYYAICQYHQPEQVMRQFGFRQGIPPPSRSLDRPHSQKPSKCDIDLVEYPFDDPYVAWYDRITRRCISCVGCGVDGVTCCLKALSMPGVPTPYRDVALAALKHISVFKKFLRLEPPQHGVFKGSKERACGGGSSSQTCSHSEVPWEQLEVFGFGASSFNHDSLVEAKRRRIEESSLGDVTFGHPRLVRSPSTRGRGGDPKGGGEVTQFATKTYVVTQRSSKRQRKSHVMVRVAQCARMEGERLSGLAIKGMTVSKLVSNLSSAVYSRLVSKAAIFGIYYAVCNLFLLSFLCSAHAIAAN
ncbi:hypothetical protein C3L33_17351, partial [Rhododendron williamsianum]